MREEGGKKEMRMNEREREREKRCLFRYIQVLFNVCSKIGNANGIYYNDCNNGATIN